MADDETTFLLVRGAGVAPDALAREIGRRVEHVDAWSRDEFSAKTSAYWMFGTGAGESRWRTSPTSGAGFERRRSSD